MRTKLFILTALLLAPLASLHARRTLPEVPGFGKLRVGSSQALENCGVVTSNDWN
jgi:hypothetical protein